LCAIHFGINHKMSYTLSVYADLITTYPTWSSLEAYLTSEAGGKLRVIKGDGPYAPLAIIRYTKGVSNMDPEHVYAFRSVVWNTQTNRPVCVAPVKSSSAVSDGADMQISEFLDGIMIQGFNGPDGPMTATRTVLGSTNKFYTNRSFAELLEDVTGTVGGTNTFLTLPSGYFVNMLLQHPEHKTITALAQPRLYVTHFGKVDDDGTVTVMYDPSAWIDTFKPYAPRVYETVTCRGSFTEPMVKYNPSPTGHVWQGLVFQEVGSYRRYRLRTDNYKKVRALRGQESHMYERFLRLRRDQSIPNYLRYFPEDNKELWACEKSFRNLSQLLLDAYTQVFKLKKNTFKDFHVSLRPHMYALHGQYINSLKQGEPYPIVYSGVVEYMNKLSLEDQKNLMRHLKDEAPVPRPLFIRETTASQEAHVDANADESSEEENFETVLGYENFE
jgi:hypothetical protein